MTELDETFVLDSYKGKQLPDTVNRKACKHGAKAEKRGISNEYVCICAGIQRNGVAYAATINCAKLDANELAELFETILPKGLWHFVTDSKATMCLQKLLTAQ